MSRLLVLVGLLILLAGAAAAAARLWFSPAVSPRETTPSTPARGSGLGDVLGTGAADSEAGPELPAGVELKFTDVTDAAGIRFQHYNARSDMDYIMETMGSGLGWIDYDQDGLMDLFLVQGSNFVGPPPERAPISKLYKNLGGGHFRDVTAETGLGHVGCGQGVAVGDFDNDGFPDLFLTCYGQPNVLYHNEPDGRGGRHFVDVTRKAGLADLPDWRRRPNWSTSACFLDYDNDGHLDLFVCSYVHVDLAHYPVCKNGKGTKRMSCSPRSFSGTRCVLYRNNGNGTFTDVSQQAGITETGGKALGVVALDLDDDGLTDIFVTNDTVPNFLFHNLGKGRFESVALASGCAVSLEGLAQAYMGVDGDDLDGDGRPDLFATAFSRETNTLWRNEGGGRFLDVTPRTGLGPPSWFMLGFGTCFVDVDRDGSLDIVVANGNVYHELEQNEDPHITVEQNAQLFLNDGRGFFRDVSAKVGGYFQRPRIGRGLAACDYDNDGSVDLAFSNNGQSPVLLHNESRTPYHWLRLELQGTASNRDAVGAKVTVHAGGRRQVRHRKGGGSYLSASDPRLLVGLGSATKADRVDVRWPSGRIQHVGPLEADRGYRIVEGKDGVTPRP
jgi:hypothetical protein